LTPRIILFAFHHSFLRNIILNALISANTFIRMKKSIALLVMILTCLFSCKQRQEDILAGIKKNVGKINDNLKTYTRKEVEDLTSRTPGNVTGYYRDNEVKRVDASRFTDTSRKFTQYYFDDGMLIYVMEQNFVYNKPMTYTEEVAKANKDSVWYDDKKTRLLVNRFYFNKNKLVKWINADNTDMPVNDIDFINRESIVWAEAAILLKELKEQ
jgi:hypothetical protein